VGQRSSLYSTDLRVDLDPTSLRGSMRDALSLLDSGRDARQRVARRASRRDEPGLRVYWREQRRASPASRAQADEHAAAPHGRALHLSDALPLSGEVFRQVDVASGRRDLFEARVDHEGRSRLRRLRWATSSRTAGHSLRSFSAARHCTTYQNRLSCADTDHAQREGLDFPTRFLVA
jgi:hypothetical protein